MKLLETKTSNYNISLKGYHNRTPAILRYIADFIILLLMPAGDGLLASMPGIEDRVWLMFWWTLGCVVFKLITKFIEEFPKPDA